MTISRAATRASLVSITLVASSFALVSAAQATATRAIPRFSIRLEDQLLASLRYLPVTFTPRSAVAVPSSTTSTTTSTTTTTSTSTTTTTTPQGTTTTTTPTSTTTTPPTKKVNGDPAMLVAGQFKWRFASLPHILRSQWRVGAPNVVLTGALMRFQSVNNLPSTGAMDGTTWRTLVTEARQHRGNPSTYDYVYVSKNLPEKAKLYANGRLIYTTLVNTGITAAPTADGTFPVYLRYTTTTMSGTNPDGTKYHDTGIPWVSYFNGGDALHGFIRASYGFPQSLGCVEMTFNSAATVWPRTPIGTLVTVVQ